MPIKYVVNSKTGEAIMTDRTENLVYHNIAKWNPDHDCFIFDDKFSYILKDDYIEELIIMMSSTLKIDSVFDNILKEGKKIKGQKTTTTLDDFRVDGDNKNKKRNEKYHYSIKFYIIADKYATNVFLLNVYQHYYQFFHKVNGNYIKYKEVKNSVVYQVLRAYIIKFFKTSIETILDKGKVGTIKEGILFSNIVESYKDEKGLINDTIYIKCKNGMVCVVKSTLISRFYYFYKGSQKPENQKRINFPVGGVEVMRKYLEKHIKHKKIK